jgi:hypothetical protein
VFAAAGRDYALFRTLYHAGLRTEETVMLDVADLHFDRGPFGKIHVRYGKAHVLTGHLTSATTPRRWRRRRPRNGWTRSSRSCEDAGNQTVDGGHRHPRSLGQGRCCPR